MLRSESIIMIREKVLEGKSAYAIGKELGFSKNTVKKYIDTESTDKHGYPTRASKLDPYKDEIDKLMSNGVFNCVVILEHIAKLGYDGKITILKDYVAPFRPPKNIPAVRRYETLPGKQAQMDWGICQYTDVKGNVHKVPAFTMVLGNSRTRFLRFTKRCDLFSLERCIIEAFEYFGGMPEMLLTDNMKTVALGREAGKVIWNSGFLDFCKDVGVIPKVCKIRRPQTKGKVERLVGYVKDNFMPGRTFVDIIDLNKQALEWCNKVNSKPLQITGNTAFEQLAEEKLLPLPNKVILDRYRYEARSVSKDGFVSYDGVRYGVPWEYSGRQVTVRAVKNKIEVLDGLQLIASHELIGSSGRMIFLEGQYRGLTEKHGLTFIPGGREIAKTVEERPLAMYEAILEVGNDC